MRGPNTPLLKALPQELGSLREGNDHRFAQALHMDATVRVLTQLQAAAARLQEVSDLLLVDLQEGAPADVGDAVLLLTAPQDLLEDLLEKTPAQTPSFIGSSQRRAGRGAEHGVSLTGSCLTINVKARIIAGQAARSHAAAHLIENFVLCGLLPLDAIEGEAAWARASQDDRVGVPVDGNHRLPRMQLLPLRGRPHSHKDADAVSAGSTQRQPRRRRRGRLFCRRRSL
mmetsp:Transcript_3601/g.7362  ORF Transcript_3601/g.7362 Transcript_3601/m.7362 type:complete len:228 (+) Transcript_3601:1417-2100(+)